MRENVEDAAHGMYEPPDFRRAPERDWYVPGEDVLLWCS